DASALERPPLARGDHPRHGIKRERPLEPPFVAEQGKRDALLPQERMHRLLQPRQLRTGEAAEELHDPRIVRARRLRAHDRFIKLVRIARIGPERIPRLCSHVPGGHVRSLCRDGPPAPDLTRATATAEGFAAWRDAPCRTTPPRPDGV